MSIHRTRTNCLGGGVSIYIHDSIKLVQELDSLFTDTFESCAVELNFHGQSILMAEFYRVPNTDDRLFNISFQTLLDLANQFKCVFLCSDQNYDLLKSHTHQPTQDFVDSIYTNGFIPTITKPTRVTHASSTLIDNIFVRLPSINKHSSFVVTDGMSDHYPCFLSYQIVTDCYDKSNIKIEKRKITDEIMLKVQQDLLFENWSILYHLSVDNLYEFLINKITDKLDKHALKKVICVRACDKFREPWMTIK